MGHIDFVDFIHLFIFNGSFCYSFFLSFAIFCIFMFGSFIFRGLAFLYFLPLLLFCIFFIYIFGSFIFFGLALLYLFYIILHWLFFILFCIFIFSCNSSFISRNIGLLVGRTVNLSVTSFKGNVIILLVYK